METTFKQRLEFEETLKSVAERALKIIESQRFHVKNNNNLLKYQGYCDKHVWFFVTYILHLLLNKMLCCSLHKNTDNSKEVVINIFNKPSFYQLKLTEYCSCKRKYEVRLKSS